jgi:cathepsin D
MRPIKRSDSHHPLKRQTFDPLVAKDSKSLFVFTGTLDIGTPKQTLGVLFDTGSYNLWVRSIECRSLECSGLPTYNPSASSTFVNTTKPATSIKYVDGTTVQGYLAFESISLGTINNPKQQFEAATETNDDSSAYDGILG